MQAVILIGIQGAGKTTFYKRRFFDTHVRINRDMLRTASRERILLAACLAAKQPFVVDNTNPTAAVRAEYIAPAKQAGFRLAAYFFLPRLRDSIRRNAGRAGKQKIPVAGLVGTWKRLEAPRTEEGFDEIFTVMVEANQEFKVLPWEHGIMAGITPGIYINRSGRYEVRPDGTIWLVAGADLGEGEDRKRVPELPPDAAMTAEALGPPHSGGTTPPGKGPDPAHG